MQKLKLINFLKNKIKSNFIQILLFFLFLLVSIILFKKFNKYYLQNDFTKIFLLIILQISFFTGSINQKLAKLNSILFIYLVIILYSVNSLLVIFEYKNTQKNNVTKILEKIKKNSDTRTLLEVVVDEQKKGKEIYPYVVPREFLKKKQIKKLPLAPLPNTRYVSCNEFGSWKKIKTDKLGFNNKVFLRSFDILLMGDSFAEGSCVDQVNEPANIFKKNFDKTAYNIGVSGNGPLLSLALAHEIKDILDFKYLIWFIYDNDFYDVKLELKSSFLVKYINKDFKGNDYFSNTDEINFFQKKYIKENIEKFKIGYSLKENLLELKPLIYKINVLIAKIKFKSNDNKIQNILKKIFHKLYFLYPEKRIFIVYLPETSCFQNRINECKQRFLDLKNSSKNLVFLNFYEHIKKKKINYKKMYAFGQNKSHFSPEGYMTLIRFINKEVNFNN